MKNIKSLLTKRLFIGAGCIFILLIGVLLVVPLFVDVDHYRPQLEQMVNSKINGKLSLGRLRLTLLGKVAVTIDKAHLQDLSQKNLVSVENAELSLPLLTLLKGKPALRVSLSQPEVSLERSEKGQWNTLSLLKASVSESDKKKEESKESKGEQKLPSWVESAQIQIDVRKAEVKITDRKSQVQLDLSHLDLETGELSLTEFPEFELRANLDTQMEGRGEVKGPFEVKSHKQNDFITFEMDLGRLKVAWGKAFRKTDKIPMRLSFQVVKKQPGLQVRNGKFVLHSAQIEFSGESDLSASEGTSLQVQVPSVQLADFTDLVPGLEKETLQGELQGNLKITGSIDQPKVEAEASLKEVKLRKDYFKHDLIVDGELKLSNRSIEKLDLGLRAPAFDLRFSSRVDTFEAPRVTMKVESDELDLDELIDWEKFRKVSVVKTDQKPDSANHSEKMAVNPVPVTDYDSLVGLLSSYPICKKASGEVRLSGKALRIYKVEFKPIKGRFALRELKLSGGFEEAQLWSGKLGLTGALDLNGALPQYQFEANYQNLNLQDAVASQMELFKNTVTGLMSGEVKGMGSSFNPVLAKKNLNANGQLKVVQTHLSTIDINRMVSEGLREMLNQIGSKVPLLKGKELKLDPVSSDFKQITATFRLKDGEFTSSDFYAQAVPEKGLDLRGDTRIGLIDYSLNGNWEVSDPYNLLKAKEVSFEEGGIRFESVLIESGKPFRFPIRMSGTLLAPRYDYTAIPEMLGEIVLNNIQLAAKQKASQELKKKAQEQIKKFSDQAPAPVKDLLKGLF